MKTEKPEAKAERPAVKTEKKVMRDVFIEGIYERMRSDGSLFFVSADFGSPKLDRLREDFGDRFLNVGIAEQNLVNVASGLALEGFTSYAYAISPFLTMRAYEQIRNNLSLLSQVKDINVNLVGVGAGLSYDVAGPSHHCLEDISIIRTLPNLIVISPSDWALCAKLVDYTIRVRKPKYLRFDGKPHVNIYDPEGHIELEKGFHELVKGEGVAIVSTGYMTHTALAAVELLKKGGINAGIIDVFILKPFDESALYEALKSYKHVVTVEEAFINKGGLDTAVSVVLERGDRAVRLKRLGFKDEHVYEMGDRAYLHGICGLDATGIANTVRELLK